MVRSLRGGSLLAGLLLSAAALSGCATTGDDAVASSDQQVAPVQDSSVSSSSLPPIGGQDGGVEVSNVPPDQASVPPGQDATPADTSDPGLAQNGGGGVPLNQTATMDAGQGSFVSLSDYGAAPNANGRDLTGGLTIEKLLGGWTVVAGADQCRLNLTYTTKTGTDRYRASAPGCAIQTLAAVSSWQLSGTQVQLFNDSDTLVGTLLLSGDRFIGTLSGGQAISMVG